MNPFDVACDPGDHCPARPRLNTVGDLQQEIHEAEYESALDRFRADMAAHREDSAKRDKDNLRWQIGLWVATVVILGIIVRWPT